MGGVDLDDLTSTLYTPVSDETVREQEVKRIPLGCHAYATLQADGRNYLERRSAEQSYQRTRPSAGHEVVVCGVLLSCDVG